MNRLHRDHSKNKIQRPNKLQERETLRKGRDLLSGAVESEEERALREGASARHGRRL